MRSEQGQQQQQRRHGSDLRSKDVAHRAEHVHGPRRRARDAFTNDEMIVSSRLKLNDSKAPASTPAT